MNYPKRSTRQFNHHLSPQNFLRKSRQRSLCSALVFHKTVTKLVRIDMLRWWIMNHYSRSKYFGRFCLLKHASINDLLRLLLTSVLFSVWIYVWIISNGILRKQDGSEGWPVCRLVYADMSVGQTGFQTVDWLIDWLVAPFSLMSILLMAIDVSVSFWLHLSETLFF